MHDRQMARGHRTSNSVAFGSPQTVGRSELKSQFEALDNHRSWLVVHCNSQSNNWWAACAIQQPTQLAVPEVWQGVSTCKCPLEAVPECFSLVFRRERDQRYPRQQEAFAT